jgi:small subunit ribosomal protein S16
MLMIRLQRIGKTKRPVYRIIVSPKHKDTQSGQLEILGTYDMVSKEKKLDVKVDRIKYWMSVGAQLSPTLNNLFINKQIIEGKKQKSVTISKDRKAKMAKEKGATAQAPAPAAA